LVGRFHADSTTIHEEEEEKVGNYVVPMEFDAWVAVMVFGEFHAKKRAEFHALPKAICNPQSNFGRSR
jgi:hypothetical protein